MIKFMTPALKKHLLLAFGWFFVGLGLIGAVLPIVPTTPFLIVAAACFSRASPRLHQWLLNLKHIGPALRNWEENRVIRRPAKILASVFITLGIGFPVVFVNVHLGVKITLVVIGLSVITYIWSQKSSIAVSREFEE